MKEGRPRLRTRRSSLAFSLDHWPGLCGHVTEVRCISGAGKGQLRSCSAAMRPFCRLAKPRWQTRYVSQVRKNCSGCFEPLGSFAGAVLESATHWPLAMCDTKWGFQTNYGHRTLPFKWQSSNGFHFYEAGRSRVLKLMRRRAL